MKPPLLFVLAILSFHSSLSEAGVRPPPNGCFAIYFTARYYDPLAVSNRLSVVKVIDPPVIRGSDLTRFDFKSGTIAVQPRVFAQLSGISKPRQFVLVANGERIFLGAFCKVSWGSEDRSLGKAAILLDHAPKYLELAWFAPHESGGIPDFSPGPLVTDPWRDPRLTGCLLSLHKLGEIKP